MDVTSMPLSYFDQETQMKIVKASVREMWNGPYFHLDADTLQKIKEAEQAKEAYKQWCDSLSR